MHVIGDRRRRMWRRHLGLVLGGGAIALCALTAAAAPILSSSGPDAQHLDLAFQPPSAAHPFGTDDLGRDVLTRVLYGGRYTLTLALAVVAAGGLAGMLIGAASGFLGGWPDELAMRGSELVMAFPAIILAMAIVVALGPGLVNAGIAMVMVWWPPYARLARGEVLAVKHLEFIEAAVAVGQRPWGIFRRAVIPNILPGMVVLATIDLGSAIVTGAGLSFLGLGATPPAPEWGAMVSAGRELLAQWWVATFPGLAIFLAVIAFNFVGDGIRDALDPWRRG
jgi:peptide/nickel transport system permease protein